MTQAAKVRTAGLFAGIGAATAAAHIGNNFTTYLVGGLIDRYGFSPLQMGAWSMAETLAYAAAMFGVAPKVARLNPRLLATVASLLVVAAQLGSTATGAFTWLLAGRIVTGLGFGLLNTSLTLAAGASPHPARALSIGIAFQTLLFAVVNIALPLVGARFGVGGMFLALGALSLVLWAGTWLLPARGGNQAVAATPAIPLGPDAARVLGAMALFAFGSLALWPFMERAAHAIGLTAVVFGRFQSLATLLSAAGNLTLAAFAARMPRANPLALALLACGSACALLTTVTSPSVFAGALIAYNVSWFVVYPLLVGVAFQVDPKGRLAVMTSGTWLLAQSFGALTAGSIAQIAGNYRIVGPLGLAFCVAAIALIWPLARRFDRHNTPALVPDIIH